MIQCIIFYGQCTFFKNKKSRGRGLFGCYILRIKQRRSQQKKLAYAHEPVICWVWKTRVEPTSLLDISAGTGVSDSGSFPLLPQPNILPCRYATACISPQGQMFTYVCIWTGERRRLICLYSAAYLIMELNILMELNIWHIILEKRHARQLLSP